MNTEIKITTSAGARTITASNLVMAGVGAALVCGAYSLLAKLASGFAALIPFIAGGLLFATLVGSFYFLMQLLKNMRASPKLRVSFWDCYTAVAVFTVMGYMATACMHAFQATGGNALELWNHGAVAAALFTIFYGMARFVGDLYKNGGKKG